MHIAYTEYRVFILTATLSAIIVCIKDLLIIFCLLNWIGLCRICHIHVAYTTTVIEKLRSCFTAVSNTI